MLALTAAVIGSYLLGSIPFGYIAGRIAGIDIRTHGSGNVGATNVIRTLGWKWGLVALLLDALKGLLPTWGLPLLFFGPGHPHARVAAGVLAIIGHMFPCWLGFRGGKGVATALGVIVVLSWPATLAAFTAFAVTFAASRIVSLCSMVGSVTFAIAEMVVLWPAPFSSSNWSRGVFALAVPALIIWRHRANIGRLRRGEEPKLVGKKANNA